MTGRALCVQRRMVQPSIVTRASLNTSRSMMVTTRNNPGNISKLIICIPYLQWQFFPQCHQAKRLPEVRECLQAPNRPKDTQLHWCAEEKEDERLQRSSQGLLETWSQAKDCCTEVPLLRRCQQVLFGRFRQFVAHCPEGQ